MKRIGLIGCFLMVVILPVMSFGGLINGVALSVNGYPITLEDIEKKVEIAKITKEQAVSILIDESLYLQSVDKYKISVDSFDIENYLEKLAKSNKMSAFEFKSAVRQQEDYDQFIEKIRLQLRHQKLINAIAANKLIIAKEEDLKIFYENNQPLFQRAKTIEAIHYSSKDKKILELLKKNPMITDPNLDVENKIIEVEKVSPQMQYIIAQTGEKNFSTIFAENNTYNILFVSKKDGIEVIPFGNVSEQIFQMIMEEREKEYLKNYFEELKITAEIKILK